VAEYYNHVIRRVDIATRAVTTVAGMPGSSGTWNGGTPLQSTFNNPCGVEADGAGNVYVADRGNNAIRMLSGEWVAGSTTGLSGSANALAGTSATFKMPYSVHADVAVGLLYVADTENYKVRTIGIAGPHAVDTLVTYTAFVRDIAVDPAAHVLYVAVGSSVYIVTYAGVSNLLVGAQNINTYADGTGSAARFNMINGLVKDVKAGVLYATDLYNNRIRRITIAGGIVTTIAGSGAAALVDGIGTAAAFKLPWGIALDAVSNTLYIGDEYNNAIRRLQVTRVVLVPATLNTAPLPPSPLASSHQLSSWRSLAIANSSNNAWQLLDVRNVTFPSPLAAANTAGLNPTIRALLLGNVTLAPRKAAPTAASNTNTTFSTSAQRGLRSLTLTTPDVPAAALFLPALTNLTLAAPVPTHCLQLTAESFNGLILLSTLAVSNIDNLSWLPALPALLALDLSGNAITSVHAHDFDTPRSLRWLSLADSNLTYLSAAAISPTKQPALAVLDQSRVPMLSGTTCPPGTYYDVFSLAASGAQYFACADCSPGASCNGGTGQPTACGANTYAAGGAAACTPCPPGTYSEGAAPQCTPCPRGIAAPTCNATASWRDTITVMADGAGNWVNAAIYLVPAGSQPVVASVSCSPLSVLSTDATSCALPFLLPAAFTAPMLTYVWVAHAGTSGVPQQLNTTVILVPPPPVVVAPGGGIGLAPLTPGAGRLALRLPAPRLTAADWVAVGLTTATSNHRRPGSVAERRAMHGANLGVVNHAVVCDARHRRRQRGRRCAASRWGVQRQRRVVNAVASDSRTGSQHGTAAAATSTVVKPSH